MKGRYMYIKPSLMILMANTFIITTGVNYRKTQVVGTNNEVKTPEKRDQRTLYEDYYQNNNELVNYDLDYYPYKSYAYDNEDESHRNLEKNQKIKHRIAVDRATSDTGSKINHLNSQKSHIKSLRKCKNSIRSKTRRNTDLKDDSFLEINEPLSENFGLLDDNLKNMKIRRDAFISLQNSDTSQPSNINTELSSNMNPEFTSNMKTHSFYRLGQQRKLPIEEYTDSFNRKMIKHPDLVQEVYNGETGLHKSDDKKSNYDYLQIYNRSRNSNDLNDGRNLKYEFVPNDFNVRSLSEILGEPKEQNKLPQCPIGFNSNNVAEYNLKKEVANFSKDNVEGVNYNDNQMPMEENYYYYEKNQDQSNEDYEDMPSNYELRPKREQKIKTFTLSFPEGKNLGSYISLKDWPSDSGSRKGKGKNGSSTQCTTTCRTTLKCTTADMCATTETICTTPETICTTPEISSTCETTTDMCTFTTEEQCTTEPLCTRATTCQTNFKELNEGSKILVDLSNYVANILNPNQIYNATLSNEKLKLDRIERPEYNSELTPKNKFSIIKFQPAHIVKARSNDIPEEFENNIFIVKLLKDISSNAQLNGVPLQSEKNYFSEPYTARFRRNLAMKNGQPVDT